MISVIYVNAVAWSVVLAVAVVALFVLATFNVMRQRIADRGYRKGWADSHDELDDVPRVDFGGRR